jgi:hypothetical protein
MDKSREPKLAKGSLRGVCVPESGRNYRSTKQSSGTTSARVDRRVGGSILSSPETPPRDDLLYRHSRLPLPKLRAGRRRRESKLEVRAGLC